MSENPPVVAWIITDKNGFRSVTQSPVTAETMLSLGHDITGLVRLSDYAVLRTAYAATIGSQEAATDRSQHVRNARINQHRRNIAWLHARADEMNDPHARAILNSAAFELGLLFPPRAALSREEGR